MSDDADPARLGRRDQQDDPREDPMGPPKEPCECWCMHCRRTFMSSAMWFQRVIGDPQGFKGFWMCPTPNCGGAGFTFDIFPTDPTHPANEGWHSFGDEEDDEEEFEEGDDEFDADEASADWNADADAGAGHAAADWDPDESKWKALDEELGDDGDDDLEGEEWKHGLQPGERPPEPDWAAEARREQEEQERKYDEPDERPRELDWSDRPDRTDRTDRSDRSDLPPRGGFTEDDIPF